MVRPSCLVKFCRVRSLARKTRMGLDLHHRAVSCRWIEYLPILASRVRIQGPSAHNDSL